MKAKTSNLDKSKIEILFNFEWNEVEPYLDRACLKLGEKVTIPGFRPGKAPKEMLKKHIGEARILSQAAEMLMDQEYNKYVAENSIQPISPPELEIKKLAYNNPLIFRILIETLPEIDLPDYKNIAKDIKRNQVKVEGKDLQDTLSWLQKSRAKFEDKDTPVEKGDFVEIEYQSPQIQNNKKFEDKFVMEKGHFVPGFEDNLIGANKGEEKQFDIKFPKDYQNKQMAGKNVSFKVKIKNIQKMILPELNNEFAKQIGKFDNLEQLKNNMKQGIEQEKNNQESQRIKAETLDKIAEKTEMQIPDSLVEHEKKQMLEQMKSNISMKMPWEDYLKDMKKTEQELLDSFKDKAKQRVKNFLILRQIGIKEKIQVTDREAEDMANQFLKSMPESKLDLEHLKRYYKEAMYSEKVLNKLQSYVPNHTNNN